MTEFEQARQLFLTGLDLLLAGDFAGAERPLRQANALTPNRVSVLTNLSASLLKQDKVEEAKTYARQAVAFDPMNHQGWSNLGACAISENRFSDAITQFEKALSINPDYAEAHDGKGTALMKLWRLAESETCFREALKIKPDFAQAHSNLGTTLQDMGRISEAEESFRTALQIKPDFEEARHKLLFGLNYKLNHDPVQHLQEARRYGEIVSKKVTAGFRDYPCANKPDRLRVGLVSGDFRSHPVAYFLEGILAHIDREKLELTGYQTDTSSDPLTTRIKSRFSGWRYLHAQSDQAAANQIYADGIHVLIDLAGHTEKNRLAMFAWRPAPVQVSWLGYFATTGVTEIDYFIADPYTLPESLENQFTEKIWRLPETRLCFTAPDDELPVAPLPALKNGYVTFGCFNNLSKLNDAVISLWARILHAVPNSRLYLKSTPLDELAVRKSLVKRFAEHQVEASQLMLEGATPRSDYLAAYNRVDITLDPFPYTGATTSAESLWMGVPVLSLAGDRLVARQGIGLLSNAKLNAWIATDTDDYLRRAITHATQLHHLQELRQNLRQQVLASPIFDAPRFARHFEDALQGMWRQWQEKNQRPHTHQTLKND